MSNRRSILATEEDNARPGSPLRRSSRIANSPAPAATATTTAPVSRRRSSATETTVSTPAKVARVKRPSLSHEITLEKPEPSKQTASKTSRASSKSPSTEPELQENTTGTPTKRGRNPSITKLKEETSKVATPNRRRSVRGQSNSPSKDVEPSGTKPRGRRPSITASASLEVINEAEVTAELKKVGRTARSSKRMSIEITEEVEPKKEEKKPATRRSIRGRSASIDTPDESELKQTSELNPINEEDNEPGPKINLGDDEEQTITKDTDDNVERTEEIGQPERSLKPKESEEGKHLESKDDYTDTLESEKQVCEQANDAVGGVLSTRDDAEIDKGNDVIMETPPSPTKTIDIDNSDTDDVKIDKESDAVVKKPLSSLMAGTVNVNDSVSSPLQKSRTSHSSESDSVYKSPVRRSPRLSASPVFSSQKLEGKILPSPEKLVPEINECNKDDSLNQDSTADKESECIQNKSLFITESPMDEVFHNQDSKVDPINDEEDNEVNTEDQGDVPITLEEVGKDDTTKTNKLLESMIVSSTTQETSMPLGSALLDESNVNLPNKKMKSRSQSPTRNLNSDKCSKRNSMLKHSPELLSGSDGSFHLNLSVPTTNSIDIDDEESRKPLDVSGGSNNSDKENNADKPNIPKSPGIKRISLSETSTPKLNKSLKLETFCEPIEVEFTTDVASTQVYQKTPIREQSDALVEKSKAIQNDSVVEVDNENEFGSSPIKAMKPPKKDVTQLSLCDEDDLMNSFVDEVLEVKSKDQPEEIVKNLKQNTSAGKSTAELPTKEDNDDTWNDVLIKSNVSTGKPELTQVSGGSKRRKVVIKENISKELDDFINAKLQEASLDVEETDEDECSQNVYVEDMASEGEEDTPSEDSNEVIDDGESLHSSESEGIEDDDDYENDSFITDDDGEGPLLSGNEYDLEDSNDDKKKSIKKGKSRIIVLSDSSDDEISGVVNVNIQEPQIEEKSSRDIEEKSSVRDKDESSGANNENETINDAKESHAAEIIEAQPVENRVKVLQNIKILSPLKGNKDTTVVINEKDNLKSLEAMKDSLIVDVPREPKPSLSTPNNSIIESPRAKSQRKTSINIQDQIKISRYSDGEITEKISKAVDYFVSSIKERTGSVSLNVSLDYANSTSPECSPKRPERLSLKKEDVDSEVIDVILESSIAENTKDERVDLNETSPKNKKKEHASKVTQTSLVDHLEALNDTDVQNISISKKNKTKRKSQSLTVAADTAPPIKDDIPTMKKRKSNFANANNSLVGEIESAEVHDEFISKKNKTKRKSIQGTDIVPVRTKEEVKLVKGKKNRCSNMNLSLADEDLNENTKRFERVTQEESSRKRKINKSLSDVVDIIDNKKKIKGNKTKKAKKPSSCSKNVLDSDGLDTNNQNLSPEKSPDMKKVLPDSLSAPPEEILVRLAKKQKMNLTRSKKPPQNSGEFIVEDEHEPFVSKSENILNTAATQQKLSGGIKSKFKNIKPSLFNNGDDWNVEETISMKPSKKMKEKSAVKLQLEGLKKKLAPNDFRNQMIYGSTVKRMESKEILKKREKTASKRK